MLSQKFNQEWIHLTRNSSDLISLWKNKRAYSAVATGWTIPATPTDLVTLNGVGNRTLRLLAVIVDGLQTTAGINKFFLIKRSTLDTGGTFVADPIVVHDSNELVSAAVFGHWTANPAALGTAIGNVRVNNLLNPAPASLVVADKLIWTFENLNAEEVTLRTATEQLALNFNGAALPAGLTLNVTFVWTEE